MIIKIRLTDGTVEAVATIGGEEFLTAANFEGQWTNDPTFIGEVFASIGRALVKTPAMPRRCSAR